MAGDAISGQLVCPACFLYLSTALPAGDTPELLCPPEDSVRQADLCARPWPSHQPPPHYGVSAYWQYYSQLRFTATFSMVSTSLPLHLFASYSLYLAVSPWAPDLPDPLFLSLLVPLICWLEAFLLFPVLWQGNQRAVNKHMGHSHLPGPQRNFCCCFWGMWVTCTWAQGSTRTYTTGPCCCCSLAPWLSLLYPFLSPWHLQWLGYTSQSLEM